MMTVGGFIVWIIYGGVICFFWTKRSPLDAIVLSLMYILYELIKIGNKIGG